MTCPITGEKLRKKDVIKLVKVSCLPMHISTSNSRSTCLICRRAKLMHVSFDWLYQLPCSSHTFECTRNSRSICCITRASYRIVSPTTYQRWYKHDPSIKRSVRPFTRISNYHTTPRRAHLSLAVARWKQRCTAIRSPELDFGCHASGSVLAAM